MEPEQRMEKHQMPELELQQLQELTQDYERRLRALGADAEVETHGYSGGHDYGAK